MKSSNSRTCMAIRPKTGLALTRKFPILSSGRDLVHDLNLFDVGEAFCL